MLWNGNVELLSHIAFIFEHGFSGKSKVSVSVSSLAFNVHDFGVATWLSILGVLGGESP